MAPERVQCKRGDARTDIYGLGAILYEMLTGVIAFDHEDPMVIMNARVTGDPEAPRRLNPVISPQAEEIVLRAMERDPALRYQTAAQMKADLDGPGQVEVDRTMRPPGAGHPGQTRLAQGPPDRAVDRDSHGAAGVGFPAPLASPEQEIRRPLAT